MGWETCEMHVAESYISCWRGCLKICNLPFCIGDALIYLFQLILIWFNLFQHDSVHFYLLQHALIAPSEMYVLSSICSNLLLYIYASTSSNWFYPTLVYPTTNCASKMRKMNMPLLSTSFHLHRLVYIQILHSFDFKTLYRVSLLFQKYTM